MKLKRAHEAPPQCLSKRQRNFLKTNLARHGFTSYREYIRSQAWWHKKEQYRASGLPQDCAVCLVPNVDLHHKTYARLGDERLTDLVPLCGLHHDELHERGLDFWRGPAQLLAERRRNSPRRRIGQHDE
jgi:hypothetical protein